jgi:hypothetical protein
MHRSIPVGEAMLDGHLPSCHIVSSPKPQHFFWGVIYFNYHKQVDPKLRPMSPSAATPQSRTNLNEKRASDFCSDGHGVPK